MTIHLVEDGDGKMPRTEEVLEATAAREGERRAALGAQLAANLYLISNLVSLVERRWEGPAVSKENLLSGLTALARGDLFICHNFGISKEELCSFVQAIVGDTRCEP